ncbi:Adenylosuccinate lyase [Symbiodinium microadriaticum]|uniref:Adenylosuccinate lyase n=1 Tax=Symbiodinium microadriaticum TaxID=2951 RepID=A0A1Q9DVV8_SYMMI|nr:Adenylosuccinate lyase [Symbiodinium microadriaticum]
MDGWMDGWVGRSKRNAVEAFGQQLPSMGARDLELAELTAVAPVDGRYRTVEIEYFLALMTQLPVGKDLPADTAEKLRAIPAKLTVEESAVEYFIKKRFDELGLEKYKELKVSRYRTYRIGLEWVHFALTSQDINNTATPMLLRDAIHRSRRG